MLEHQQQQLVNGLQELYKLALQGNSWEGAPLNDNGTGRPLTHDILSRLGVLAQDNQEGAFDDDLESMQQRLIRDGAGMVTRGGDSSASSDGSKSPSRMSIFESSSMQRVPSTPFVEQLPTPPMHSPLQQTVPMKGSHARSQTAPTPSFVQWDGSNVHPSQLNSANWCSSPISFEGQMMNDFQMFTGVQSSPSDLMLTSPDVAMSNWAEEDFSNFLNTSLT